MASASNCIPEVHAYATVGQRRLARVYVWELPVRLAHWFIFISVGTLCVTGWYIHRPFLISRGPFAFTMGNMRFLHILAGYILLVSVAVRGYWALAGNYWANWKSLIPTNREKWKSLGNMIKYYTFFRREPVHGVGHNPLAGMAYVYIFFALLVEVFTGLVLYSQTRGPGIAHSLFGWAGRILDYQYLRFIHYLGMFFVLAFVIHHVYSAILVSIEERNGMMEGIFSGYKFVSEGDLKEEEEHRRNIKEKSLPSRLARKLTEREKRKKGA
jgi:Ni/Fe-hydrogenase 1 B-type cytochrome subunit